MLHMPWRKWSTSSDVHKGSSVYIWCQQLGELHQVSAGEFGTATTNISLGLVESWCQRQTCCNLVWLHQVSPGWLCGGTTNADWSFCTIRWRWQCVVVINGNVMNQSNWSPTWAEARLKQIPLEISELFPKQNLIHVQCFKNRWFHFSMYSPPLVVITLSNIWSLHWIV